MGVDFYSCDVCNEALYEEYVGSCEACGSKLCMDCLVGTEEFTWNKRTPYIIEQVWSDKGIKEEHCPFCSGSLIDEGDMVRFLLKELEITYDEAKEAYFKKVNNNG
jgi:hypothetical protein